MKKFFTSIGKGIERLLTKVTGNLSELLEQQNQIIRILMAQNERLRLSIYIVNRICNEYDHKCREYEKKLIEIIGSTPVEAKTVNIKQAIKAVKVTRCLHLPKDGEAGFAFIAYPEVLDKIRSEALAALAELDIENCYHCQDAGHVIDGIIGKVNAAIGPPKSPGLSGFKTEDDGGE